jgi:hypothetical protein
MIAERLLDEVLLVRIGIHPYWQLQPTAKQQELGVESHNFL